MNKHELDIIKTVLMGFASFFALVIAIINLIDKLPDSTLQQRLKAFYARLWEVVTRRPWGDLAGAVLDSIMQAKERLFVHYIRQIYLLFQIGSTRALILFTLALPGPWIVGGQALAVHLSYFRPAIITMVVVLWSIPLCEYFLNRIGKTFSFKYIFDFFPVAGIYFTIISGWLNVLPRLSLQSDIFCALSLLPGFIVVGTYIAKSLDEAGKTTGDSMTLVGQFSVYLPASFLASLLAMIIGHTINPGLYTPKSWQMLLANTFCDTCTLFATARILAALQKNSSGLAATVAILANLLVAIIFGFLSLWFGLVHTPHSIPLSEVAYTLVGRVPGQPGWNFGPNFWLMHTTFIPVALLLTLIALAYLAKTLLRPINWLARNAKAVDKPLGMTSAFLGVIAAVCFGLGQFGVQVLSTFFAK